MTWSFFLNIFIRNGHNQLLGKYYGEYNLTRPQQQISSYHTIIYTQNHWLMFSEEIMDSNVWGVNYFSGQQCEVWHASPYALHLTGCTKW